MTLNQAIRLARARPLIRPKGHNSISRFCAILSSKNLSFVGYNSYHTSPFYLKYNPWCFRHAELHAVQQALQYFTKIQGRRRDDTEGISLGNFSLYIARVLVDGSPALAKPCRYCSKCLSDFGIHKIYFT